MADPFEMERALLQALADLAPDAFEELQSALGDRLGGLLTRLQNDRAQGGDKLAAIAVARQSEECRPCIQEWCVRWRLDSHRLAATFALFVGASAWALAGRSTAPGDTSVGSAASVQGSKPSEFNLGEALAEPLPTRIFSASDRWDPAKEKRTSARQRLVRKATEAINAYLRRVEPTTRPLKTALQSHAAWLVQYQVLGLPWYRITKKSGKTFKTTQAAVRRLAAAFELQLRPPNPRGIHGEYRGRT